MRRLTFPDQQQNSAQRKHSIASEYDREVRSSGNLTHSKNRFCLVSPLNVRRRQNDKRRHLQILLLILLFLFSFSLACGYGLAFCSANCREERLDYVRSWHLA